MLTHAHPDHQGASHEICTRLSLPFWVGEGDVDAAQDPSLIGGRQPTHPIARLMDTMFTGPGHPVDRILCEGDEVAGFRVLDTPGHSRGHIALFRESDRVLILGDVLNSADPLTGIRGLRLPKDFFTPDPQQNRAPRPAGSVSSNRALSPSGMVRPCTTRTNSWLSAARSDARAGVSSRAPTQTRRAAGVSPRRHLRRRVSAHATEANARTSGL